MFQSLDSREVRTSRTRAGTLSRRARTSLAIVERLEERTLLTGPGTTLYVELAGSFSPANPSNNQSVTWVPTAGTAFTSSVSNLTFGTDAFTSIQAAVNAAAPGDTIEVDAGTYNEGVSIPSNLAGLTILGAEYGVDARTRSAPEAIINNSGGAFGIYANNVTINGFTIQGDTNSDAGPGFGYAIYTGASQTTGTQILNNVVQNNIAGIGLSNSGASQVKIQYNLFQNNNAAGQLNTDIYSDQYVSGGGTNSLSNVLIDSNTFTNTSLVASSWAIGISNTDTTHLTSGLTITNNTVTNHGRGLYFYSSTNVNISGNSITGTSSGHYAIGLFDDDSNFTIATNNLSNNDVAIDIESDFGNPNSAVTVHGNDLHGNTTAALDFTLPNGPGTPPYNTAYSGTLDASGNYWGSSNPTTVAGMIVYDSSNSSSIAATQTAIDFTPLLDNVGTDDSPGYTPDLSSVTVHSLGAQVGATGRIQEGVNLVSSGGTVNVAPGTYTGAVDATGTDVTLAIGGPSTTGIVTNDGNFTLGPTDTLAFKVNGPAAGTDFDQWMVNGVVTLDNAQLATSGTGSAPVLPLILNDGTDPVVGTFLNQPEASTVVVNGVTYAIRYDYNADGTANDVVLYQGADLAIGISGPATAVAGDPAGFNYTIVVTNTGPLNNTGGFTVTDTLPSGLTFQSAGSTPGAVVTGSTVSFTNPSGLASGAAETFVIHVTLASSMPTGSQFHDSATVASNGTSDFNPANNTATTVTTTVSTQTDLAVTNTLSGPVKSAGQTQTFTVTITNNGPSDATDVVLTDSLPLNCVLVSETQNAGPAFAITSSTANGVVTLNGTTPTLGAGVSATFTIVTRLASPEPNGYVISSTATVSTSTPETNLTNNQAIAKGFLSNQTAVALKTTASPSPVSPGGKLTYTLTVTDTGPNPAQNVTLVDTLPSNATLRGVAQTSGPASSVSAPPLGSVGGKVTWTLATLAPGQSATFTITVIPTATAHFLTNQASTTCSNVNPNAGTPQTIIVTPVSSSTPAVVATIPDSKPAFKSA